MTEIIMSNNRPESAALKLCEPEFLPLVFLRESCQVLANSALKGDFGTSKQVSWDGRVSIIESDRPVVTLGA